MARFYDTTYDPAKDSGTSGAEISDINPEQAYDVDLRRLEMDKRGRWEELLHYDISTIDPEFIKDWYKKHVHDKAPATENAFRRLNTINFSNFIFNFFR